MQYTSFLNRYGGLFLGLISGAGCLERPGQTLRLVSPEIIAPPFPIPVLPVENHVSSGRAATEEVTNCGEITIDDGMIPLDCASSDYARVPAALVPSSLTSSINPASLPEYIDRRHEQTEGPVRHQRGVGSSSALALASVLDQAMLSQNIGGVPVSAMHVWARTRVASLANAVQNSLGHGLTTETLLPYDESIACAWAEGTAARLCAASRGSRDRLPVGYLASAGTKPTVFFYEISALDGKNVDVLRYVLAQHQDVLTAVTVDVTAWQRVVRSSEPDPLLPDYNATLAVQSVALVGYAHQDNGWYFLIKNSWGTSWGASGYAWIHEATLRRNVLAAFTVRATRFVGASAPVESNGCPNGICQPEAKVGGECATDLVNLAGRCVTAAPIRSGVDPTSRVAYACRPAGCTYTWSRGTLGCTSASCSMTCPAPAFHVAVEVARKKISCTTQSASSGGK